MNLKDKLVNKIIEEVNSLKIYMMKILSIEEIYDNAYLIIEIEDTKSSMINLIYSDLLDDKVIEELIEIDNLLYQIIEKARQIKITDTTTVIKDKEDILKPIAILVKKNLTNSYNPY